MKKQVTSIALDEQLKQAANRVASERGQNFSSFVRYAIQLAVIKHDAGGSASEQYMQQPMY